MLKSKTKDKQYPVYHRGGKLYMECCNSSLSSKFTNGRVCNNLVEIRDNDVRSVLCWKCLAEKIPMPVIKHEVDSDKFPRGWALKREFVDADGNVYHKGVLKPELKNTLPPTKIEEHTTKAKPKKREETTHDGDIYLEINSLRLQLKREKTQSGKSEINKKIESLYKKLKVSK